MYIYNGYFENLRDFAAFLHSNTYTHCHLKEDFWTRARLSLRTFDLLQIQDRHLTEPFAIQSWLQIGCSWDAATIGMCFKCAPPTQTNDPDPGQAGSQECGIWRSESLAWQSRRSLVRLDSLFAAENAMKTRIWCGALKSRLAVCRLDLEGARLDSAAPDPQPVMSSLQHFGHQQARPLPSTITIILKDSRGIYAHNVYPDRLKSVQIPAPQLQRKRPETVWEVTSSKRPLRKKMRISKQDIIWKFPKCQSTGLKSTGFRASHFWIRKVIISNMTVKSNTHVSKHAFKNSSVWGGGVL